MKIQANQLNTHNKNQINEMKLKNDYTIEAEAHGFGPNPQDQLSKTISVKHNLNTHFISKDSLITSI